MPTADLNHLDQPFSLEELQGAISDIAAEKAPGPDGFIGLFFKKCWHTIKVDLLNAVNQMSALDGKQWSLLNSAFIVLIPKKDNALRPQDYRPISLTHSVAKILGKLLASRVAPQLQHIISVSQSAFLKGRSIQDNFLYVQNLIQSLHRDKKPTLFLKLDIAKAFDSVKWDYLLDVLKRVGFSQRFRDLIAISLASTSSRIILNGEPGAPFLHRRGLRQGDPLSPLLFLLAIDPLQRILEKATEEHILSPISYRSASVRISMYADDAALFINPSKTEVAALQEILAAFGNVSGLCTNFNKSAAYPIGCEEEVIEEVLSDFEGDISSLPCKYLGLPLSLKKPRRIDFQILIDKIAAKLAGWKGKLLNKMGRLTLINSVLTSITTFYLTMFAPSKWIIKRIDKLRRNFLWKGEEEASGGHCAVNWNQVCSPKKFGGLGIKSLALYSRSLRLRWAWYTRKSPSRPWVGSQLPCSKIDLQLFNASTTIRLGDGKCAQFWNSAWLNGASPKDIAPNLFSLARRKNATVENALHQGRWMKGIERLSTTADLLCFIDLWHQINRITLSDQPDEIDWRWNGNKNYTTASAYNAQFTGSIMKPQLNAIWKTKVEGKVKFFAWLLVQNRLPTADRLRARGCDRSQ